MCVFVYSYLFLFISDSVLSFLSPDVSTFFRSFVHQTLLLFGSSAVERTRQTKAPGMPPRRLLAD